MRGIWWYYKFIANATYPKQLWFHSPFKGEKEELSHKKVHRILFQAHRVPKPQWLQFEDDIRFEIKQYKLFKFSILRGFRLHLSMQSKLMCSCHSIELDPNTSSSSSNFLSIVSVHSFLKLLFLWSCYLNVFTFCSFSCGMCFHVGCKDKFDKGIQQRASVDSQIRVTILAVTIVILRRRGGGGVICSWALGFYKRLDKIMRNSDQGDLWA
jgi:hypothetical protein